MMWNSFPEDTAEEGDIIILVRLEEEVRGNGLFTGKHLRKTGTKEKNCKL